MPGFPRIREYAEADANGRTLVSHFRKVPSQTTVAGNWYDLSMASGNPVPNYYASAPLEAATLDGFRGLWHGDAKAPASKHLTDLNLMTPTAGLVGQYILLDYLLYYPFVDADTTDEQPLVNDVALPRYADGDGVMVMAVAVTPSTGGGVFTFNYLDHAGNPKTSPAQGCGAAAANIGTLVTSVQATPQMNGPFLGLASGSLGVRSITSVTFSVLNGGLLALVLVKPLLNSAIREINTPKEVELIRERMILPRIYDGAYLNLIMNCAATVAAGLLAGKLATAWSK
jgi:hypothetical protein